MRFFKSKTGKFALFLLATALLYSASTAIHARMEKEAQMSQPCYEDHAESRCYVVPNNMCVPAWERFSEDCKQEARAKVTRKNATALIGSNNKSCVYKKFDRLFNASRRIATDENNCQEHFNYLDAPRIK